MMYKHQTFGWSLVTLSGRHDRAGRKMAPMPLPRSPRIHGGHTKIFPAFSRKEAAMTKRMNLVQAKEIEGREKPIWIRLGSVFMDGDNKTNAFHATSVRSVPCPASTKDVSRSGA